MKTKGTIILALCSILFSLNIAAQDDLWGGSTFGNQPTRSTTNSRNSGSSSSNSKGQASAKGDYGSDPVHGKIIKKESSNDGVQHNNYTYYADGYVSCVGRRPCTICNASGKCSTCFGTGVGSFNYPCYMCTMNRGKCNACYGTGQFVVSTGFYLNDNGGSYAGGSYSGGSSGVASGNYSSGSSSRSGGSSVYTKCTSCNGTGRCTSCNGRGYKFNSYSGHDDSCPSCRGKGSCPICYGRGRL